MNGRQSTRHVPLCNYVTPLYVLNNASGGIKWLTPFYEIGVEQRDLNWVRLPLKRCSNLSLTGYLSSILGREEKMRKLQEYIVCYTFHYITLKKEWNPLKIFRNLFYSVMLLKMHCLLIVLYSSFNPCIYLRYKIDYLIPTSASIRIARQ